MPQFFQTYDPLGNVWLSTLVAGLPIFVLLYFLAIHPHRQRRAAPSRD